MASDLDPWAEAGVPDWSADAKVTIRGKTREGKEMHPLEMPQSWALDMLTRWRERNAPNFGKELAETTKRWAAGEIGGDG